MPTTDSSFKELKFLIRRASILNSNFIISYKFLSLLCELYKKVELMTTSISIKMDIIKEQKSFDLFENNFDLLKKSRNDLLQEFQVFSSFFVSQIKELLYNNEARSIELEIRLLYFEKHATSTMFKQLIRMIREENGAIIKSFGDFLEDTNLLNHFSGRDLLKKLKDTLTVLSNENHYRYKLLNEFVNNNIFKNTALLNFFKLRMELRRELNLNIYSSNGEYSEMTNKGIKYFMNSLSKLIAFDNHKKSVGSFLIVKYKKTGINPYYLLHNDGNEKDLIKQQVDEFLNSYLNTFLENGQNPIGHNNLTIIEFHRIMDSTWIDLFANETEITSSIFKSAPIVLNNNRLLLIRIDNDSLSKDNKIEPYGQAVVGFYFNVEDSLITNIEIIRYILLLRQDISKYLRSYCENDKFRDWVDKEKQLEDALTSDHDYNSILNKLIAYRTSEVKFDYLFSLVSAKDDLKYVIDNKKINRDIVSIINIKDEIYLAYKLLFENRKPNNMKLNIRIPNDLNIQYPKFIFRAIIYEYIKNANSHLFDFTADQSSKRPYFSIVAHKLKDESIQIRIRNNSIFDYSKVKPYKEVLFTKGYAVIKEKGLYKNCLLLKATDCNTPVISFSEPTSDEVFDFIIDFNIKKYGPTEN